MKYNVKGLLISIMVLVLMPSPAWAMEAAPVMAPLNPDFVEYQQNLESATAASGDDYHYGLIPSPLKRYDGPIDTSQVAGLDLPAQFDLRTTGLVPPIRDQNPYGSCWAFAMYAL